MRRFNFRRGGFLAAVSMVAITTAAVLAGWMLDRLPFEIGAADTGRLLLSMDNIEVETSSLDKSPARETPAAPYGPLPDPAHVELETLKGSDIFGYAHRFGESPETKAIVFVWMSLDCPISNAAIPQLNDLALEFGDRGVELFGVISDPSLARHRAVEHANEYRVIFPVLLDVSGELFATFKPSHTPQAFAVSSDGSVLYSGRIDDRYVSVGRKQLRASRHDLREAILAAVADKPVAVTVTQPVGCLIERDKAAASSSDEVTFARDIAPIIYNNCTTCHRSGQTGPFPLATYEEVSKRANQIREVTQTRFMPPWRPEPNFGHFRDCRRLSDHELELLARWADAGAPLGDPHDVPPPPAFVDGWTLGQPDVIFSLPRPFKVPAAGDDLYHYFVIPTGFQQDRVVSAIEIRPTTPRVVHHASLIYDTRGWARRLDALDPHPGYERFGGPGFIPEGTLFGWAPGATPRHLPEGTGRLVKANADIVMQGHFHPSGKEEIEQTKIGLYFAPPETKKFVLELLVANLNLKIPAGESRHRHEASYTLPIDVTVRAVTPHMHLLGREMKVTATLPDGRVEPMIWIKDWAYNWQDQYVYVRPLHLPKGSRIDVEAYYDNSTGNPFNPNSPPKDVGWGDQSSDEMGICFCDVTTGSEELRQQLYEHNFKYTQKQYEKYPWMKEPPAAVDAASPSGPPAEEAPREPSNELVEPQRGETK